MSYRRAMRCLLNRGDARQRGDGRPARAFQFSGAMHFRDQYDHPVHDGPRASYQVEVRCIWDTVNTEKTLSARLPAVQGNTLVV